MHACSMFFNSPVCFPRFFVSYAKVSILRRSHLFLSVWGKCQKMPAYVSADGGHFEHMIVFQGHSIVFKCEYLANGATDRLHVWSSPGFSGSADRMALFAVR